MGATRLQAATFYDNLLTTFPTKPTRRGGGGVDFAGNLWPPLKITVTPPVLPNGSQPPPHTKINPGASFKRDDATTALREARAMIMPALLLAKGAVSGANDKGIEVMERWFGPRPVAPLSANQRDWWVGVVTILGVIESFLTSDVHLYYRGSEVRGKPNDYPGETGNLTSHDVSGYAETMAGDRNSRIGLCKLFFAKQVGTGQGRMKLRGYDSVGGTLVHELSHNLCNTEDHEMPGGGTAYGTPDCLILKAQRQWRAWYNADNIEYFCEEVLYGTGVAPTATVTTSKVQGLKNSLGIN